MLSAYPYWTIVLSGLVVPVVLTGCLAASAGAPVAKPEIDRSVQASVATAQAQDGAHLARERGAVQATATAATRAAADTRATWVTVGREFFAADRLARELAQELDAQIPLAARDPLLQDDRTSDVQKRLPPLKDQVALLPLPADASAVRGNLLDALNAIDALRGEVDGVRTHLPPGISAQEHERRAHAAKARFDAAWQAGYDAIAARVQDAGIALTEVGAQPRATATP